MTDFEFEFFADGEEFPYWEMGSEWLKIQDDPAQVYRLATIIYVLSVVCCLGVPIGCCCMMAARKGDSAASGNQIVDHATLVTDANDGKHIPVYDH